MTKWKGMTCKEDGCERPVHCRAVCTRHYRRMHYEEHERERRGSKPMKRLEIGDTLINSNGYREVKVGNKKDRRYLILEHRHVMEQHLGRELESFETVHHKNGDILDNRLENLELWASRHPRGQRVEDLLDFAYYIIASYSDDAEKLNDI